MAEQGVVDCSYHFVSAVGGSADSDRPVNGTVHLYVVLARFIGRNPRNLALRVKEILERSTAFPKNLPLLPDKPARDGTVVGSVAEP